MDVRDEIGRHIVWGINFSEARAQKLSAGKAGTGPTNGNRDSGM